MLEIFGKIGLEKTEREETIACRGFIFRLKLIQMIIILLVRFAACWLSLLKEFYMWASLYHYSHKMNAIPVNVIYLTCSKI